MLATSMEGIRKPKRNITDITRSRGGCFNCKRLKIKCNQTRPKCEYCTHRNRECVYPINLVTVEFTQPPQQEERSLMKYSYDVSNHFNLNNATNQLGISRFELRLLKFFNNYCVQDMTNGVNDTIHSVWLDQIPPLFLESELIRNSIYSYASLNLNPLCEDLNQIRIQDNEVTRFKRLMPFISKEDLSLLPDSKELLSKTSIYFSNTIIGKHQLLDKLNKYKGDYYSHNQMLMGTELSVSSMLLILFLSIHSHRILPLICFDKSETDLLSICKGLRQTIMLFQPTLRCNAFRDVFKFDRAIRIPPAKESQYPIVVELRQDLESEYENRELSSTTNEEYLALCDALEHLQACFFRATAYGHSIPIIRWLSLLSAKFHELVYEKNFFALRVIYVYTSLTTLTKFQIYKHANVWIDYMNWYKQHNFELYNDWKYTMDRSLYFLVFQKDFKFIEGNFDNLQSFDPEFFEQVVYTTVIDDVIG